MLFTTGSSMASSTGDDDGTKCVVYSDIYVDDEGNYVETIGTYDEVIAEPSAEDIASLKAKDTGDKSDKSDKNDKSDKSDKN